MSGLTTESGRLDSRARLNWAKIRLLSLLRPDSVESKMQTKKIFFFFQVACCDGYLLMERRKVKIRSWNIDGWIYTSSELDDLLFMTYSCIRFPIDLDKNGLEQAKQGRYVSIISKIHKKLLSTLKFLIKENSRLYCLKTFKFFPPYTKREANFHLDSLAKKIILHAHEVLLPI